MTCFFKIGKIKKFRGKMLTYNARLNVEWVP